MNEKGVAATAKMKPGQSPSRSPETPLPPVERLDRYELEHLLGKGGFASVYQAYDPRIRRPVAIKRCSSLDESDHERFFREAEIAGNLSHVNIVRIFDFGVADGTPFIVQELLSGQDLTASIESGLELSSYDRVQILLQVAQGLAYAHSRGVIHRDVKPANIRVLDDGAIKLLDFGVAAIQNAPSQLTQDGMTVGTAAYLSPEQIRGESPDRATDVFSFGVVAYELLTGHRPFDGETLSAVLYRIAHQAPEALRSGSLPDSLVGLVHKCLEKSKADRPASFEQIIGELEAALRDPRLRPPSAATNPTEAEPREPPVGIPPDARQPAGGAPQTPPRPTRLGDLALEGRTRAVRDSSSRIQAVRRPRRLGGSLLALAALLVAVPLYLGREGPMPEPAAAAWAEAQGWIADKVGEWQGLLAPAEPALAAKTLPAESVGTRTATPTTSDREPPGDDEDPDPVSAVIASLEAARPPTPRAPSRSTKTKRRRVSPTAPATVFLPPSWHPRMAVSVDGGPFRRLASRQTRELAPGRHTLTFGLETETFSTRETLDILLDPAEVRTIESPLAPPGALRFRIIPEFLSGQIEIDGRLVSLPISEPELIAPGPHKLVFHPSPDDPLGPLAKSASLAPSVVHLATFDMRRRHARIEVVEPFEWNGE